MVATPMDGDGYPIVMLTRDKRRTPKRVHRLIAVAFWGESQNALHKEVAHLDGNRSNCRASNLKWVSRRENISHKRIHGTAFIGSAHPRAKLSESDVIAIRAARRPAMELAELYGVSKHTISDIRRRRRWCHI